MPNLLDVFAIGFKSQDIKDFSKNLKSTEKELDKAEKKVNDLEKALEELKKEGKQDSDEFKKLSVELKQAQTDVNKFSNEIQTMQGKSQYQLMQLRKNFMLAARQIAQIAAVAIAVKKSMQFYEEAAQLDYLSKRADVAVDSLQRLGNAAARFGGSTADTAQTVGQFRTPDFKEKAAKYGITVDPNAEKTLENIALKMQSLKSEAEKIDLADNLGIDDGTTKLLIEGVERYREELKRADKYRLYTKEDIERMKDYQQAQQDIRLGVQTIWGTIARALLPSILQISKVIRAVTSWLAEHEGAVKIAAVFISIAAAVGLVTGAVKLLSVALGFLAANPIVLGIMAVIAAITLLIAIQQDYLTFLQGGESIIGNILKRLGIDTDKLRNNVIGTLKAVIEWVKNTIDYLIKLGGKLAEIARFLMELWANAPKILFGIAKALNPIEIVKINMAKGQQQINAANNNALNAVPAGAISNYYSTQAINNNNSANTNSILYNNANKGVNIGTINVQTQAMDGAGLARELAAITEQDNGFLV